MDTKRLDSCLCCGNTRLKPVLDLGAQPLANSYTESMLDDTTHYPLGINLCEDCWHAQLTVCVDRTAIFESYSYLSGTSNTLIQYFAWFAQALKDCIPKQARVLEIAANDGSLIHQLQKVNVDVLGIDPAENIVESAQLKGLPIIQGFWPAIAKEIEGKFDAIICMNVVAHVDNPGQFIGACMQKLNPHGFILVQPSQARMFGNMEFDTCYHEHLSFFNNSSIRAMAERYGLKLFDSFLVKIHGDSPVYILGLPDSPPDFQKIKQAFSVGDFAIAEDLAAYENAIRLYTCETYTQFQQSAKNTINNLRDVITAHRSQGFDIAFVGAAAKAMTVINSAKVSPDYFFDEAPLKIGRYPPGLKIKVSALSECSKLQNKTLFIITAWNFKDELVNKIVKLGVPTESKFYTYFPQAAFLSL